MRNHLSTNGPRSNNHIEGCNGGLNKHPNIYKFVEGNLAEEASQNMRYCKLEQGILKERCRDTRDVRRDKKILSYENDYLNDKITSSKLLNHLSCVCADFENL